MLNLFKKKTPPDSGFQVDPARYKGRPLLMLLDNFVLSCIGQLPGEKEHNLHLIVQKVWPGPGDWKQRLSETLQLDPAIEPHIVDLWHKNTDIAKSRGEVLSPVRFAIMIVDDNFAHLVERL